MGNYIEDLIQKTAVNPYWQRDEAYSKAFYLTQRLGIYDEFITNFKYWYNMGYHQFLENFGFFMLEHGYNIETK
jgi:hypothetical protein